MSFLDFNQTLFLYSSQAGRKHIEDHTAYNSSVGKESACSAGDPSSIPGSGKSAGEGIGYPLQYSWAALAWASLAQRFPASSVLAREARSA